MRYLLDLVRGSKRHEPPRALTTRSLYAPSRPVTSGSEGHGSAGCPSSEGRLPPSRRAPPPAPPTRPRRPPGLRPRGGGGEGRGRGGVRRRSGWPPAGRRRSCGGASRPRRTRIASRLPGRPSTTGPPTPAKPLRPGRSYTSRAGAPAGPGPRRPRRLGPWGRPRVARPRGAPAPRDSAPGSHDSNERRDPLGGQEQPRLRGRCLGLWRDASRSRR